MWFCVMGISRRPLCAWPDPSRPIGISFNRRRLSFFCQYRRSHAFKDLSISILISVALSRYGRYTSKRYHKTTSSPPARIHQKSSFKSSSSIHSSCKKCATQSTRRARKIQALCCHAIHIICHTSMRKEHVFLPSGKTHACITEKYSIAWQAQYIIASQELQRFFHIFSFFGKKLKVFLLFLPAIKSTVRP